VYVYDASGELSAEYGSATGTSTQYPVQDHLGSTRLVVDGTGRVQSCHDYLPFGEEIAAGVAGRTSWHGGTELTEKFTGKEREGVEGADLELLALLVEESERLTAMRQMTGSGRFRISRQA
jgi:hypothetical protein